MVEHTSSEVFRGLCVIDVHSNISRLSFNFQATRSSRKKILNSTSIAVARPTAAVVLTAEDGEDDEGLRYERNVSIYRCGQIPKLHAR
jgi:hypothetical protein